MSHRPLGLLALATLVATVALAVSAAQREPRVALDDGGRLLVFRLPPLLTEEEVRRHLDSGLTTSLVLQGGPQGATRIGAARVDVRYELWDEVYLVTAIDGAGEVKRSRHASADALAKWWSEAEFVLAVVPEGDRAAGQARVSLAVVPFSQAELVDTQRWLAESIGQARDGPRTAGEGASGAVGVLIATSMQRRAVRSLVWNVPLERRAER